MKKRFERWVNISDWGYSFARSRAIARLYKRKNSRVERVVELRRGEVIVDRKTLEKLILQYYVEARNMSQRQFKEFVDSFRKDK